MTVSVNRNYPKMTPGNDLSVDVPKLNETIDKIDTDVQELVGKTTNIPPKESPVFTGVPTAPTALPGTSDQQLANTQFVAQALAGFIDAAPELLDTIGELAAALGNDENFAATMTAALADKASLAQLAAKLDNAGGTLTGNLTAPALISSASKSDTPLTNLFIRDVNSLFGLRHSLTDDLCVDVNNSGSAVNALKVTQEGILLQTNKPAFLAHSAPALTASGQPIYAATTFNVGSHYNTATGLFTAPVAGLYEFYFYSLVDTSANTSAYTAPEFRVNGATQSPQMHSSNSYSRAYNPLQFSSKFSLAEGDAVGVHFPLFNGASTFGSPFNSFTGSLIG